MTEPGRLSIMPDPTLQCEGPLSEEVHSFNIQINSEHKSGSPRASKYTILNRNISLQMSSSMSLSDFKTIFKAEAFKEYFPHLQHNGDEEAGAIVSSGAIIPLKQRVAMNVFIRNGNEDVAVAVVPENWESVVTRTRAGERLTVVWWVEYIKQRA
jgi:hypothetical protein